MSDTHVWDGSTYRPLQVEASAGERPYDTGMLRARASNLQHAATHWGTEYTIRAPMSDADDVYAEGQDFGAPDKLAWYATGNVAYYGSFLRIPFRIHPRLSEIEITWWCRVSHEVIDADEGNPSVSADIAARPIPNGVMPLSGGAISHSTTFTSRNATDGSSNPVSQWFVQTMTVPIDAAQTGTRLRPQYGWLSLEVQSDFQERKKIGPVSQPADEDTDGELFIYNTAVNGDLQPLDEPDAVTRVRQGGERGLETTVNILGLEQSVLVQGGGIDYYNPHGEYPGISISAGSSDYELEKHYLPYFHWRAAHVREQYEPRTFKGAELASLIPPQSDTPRKYARQAQDMQRRGAMIWALDAPKPVGSMGTSSQTFVDTGCQLRKWPAKAVVFLSFLHTLEIQPDKAFMPEYRAEDWGQIQEDSPTIDLEVEARLGPALPALGSKTTATDTRQVTAYAESTEGPNIIRADNFVQLMQAGEPQNPSSADRDFGGSVVQYYDTRKIFLDLPANADLDWRVPQRLQLLAQITDGPDYPDGTPLKTSWDASDVATTLHHAAVWSVPQ